VPVTRAEALRLICAIYVRRAPCRLTSHRGRVFHDILDAVCRGCLTTSTRGAGLAAREVAYLWSSAAAHFRGKVMRG
jgi:hypothetical protein